MPPRDQDTPKGTSNTELTLHTGRSATLRYLARVDGPVENLKLITAAVREAERKQRGCSVTDLSFDSVHLCVLQEQLPALNRDELIEFDRVSGQVSLAVPADELSKHLEDAASD